MASGGGSSVLSAPASRGSASGQEPVQGLPSSSTVAPGAVAGAAGWQRAAAAAGRVGVQSDPGAPSSRSETARLCRQFSQLLDSSDAELRQVRRELQAAQRAQAAAVKIGAAALEAAVGAAEAAAEVGAGAASASARSIVPAAGPAGSAKPAAEGREMLRRPVHPTVAPAVCGAEHSLDAHVHIPVPLAPPAAPSVPPTPAECREAAECPAAETEAASAAPSASASQQGMQAAPADGQPVSGQAPHETIAVGPPLLPALPGGCEGCAGQQPVPGAADAAAELAAAAAEPALHPTDTWQQAAAQDGAPMTSQAWPPAVQDAAEASFSVASDEPLPDSPKSADSPGLAGDSSSYCSSLVGPASGQSRSEASLVDELCRQAPAEDSAPEPGLEPAGEAQQAWAQQEDSQGLLAELATLSLLPASKAAESAADARAPAAGADGSAADEAGLPAAGGPAACDPAQTRDVDSGRHDERGGNPAEPSAAWLAGSPGRQVSEGDPYAAGGGELAGAEHLAVEAPASPLLALPAPLDEAAAPGAAASQAPARASYNPLRADEQRAAAARRAELAAGWRQLRERADMLALWHEYAAELGVGPAAVGPAAAGNAPAAGGEAAQVHGRPHLQAPRCEEHSAVAASPGVAVLVPPAGQRTNMLWQPDWQPSRAGVTQAARLATPPPPPAAGPESSDSGCDSATPASSSCLTISSEDTSIGVAAR